MQFRHMIGTPRNASLFLKENTTPLRLPFSIVSSVLLVGLALIAWTLAAAGAMPIWFAVATIGVFVIGWSVQVYRLRQAVREMEKHLGAKERFTTVEIAWYSSKQSLITCCLAIILMLAAAAWYFADL